MLALTQTDVAEALAISQKRVSEIERGQVDRTKVDTLHRYADALGGTLRVESRSATRPTRSPESRHEPQSAIAGPASRPPGRWMMAASKSPRL